MFSLRLAVTAARNVRYASTASAKARLDVAGSNNAHDLIHQLEQDGSRILRIVQKKVDERLRLLSEISEEQSSPADVKRARQAKELEPLNSAWDEWTSTKELLLETYPLLSDSDPTMRSLASEEYQSLSSTLSTHVSQTFPALLIPPSPTAHMSALMDFKSGVGGSESSLFLAELMRMYLRYASSSFGDPSDPDGAYKAKWKTEIMAQNEADGGGIKDAIVEIKGPGAYDALRWESGVHRVQRVPATETSGRVHTSTVAIIVLPLAEESDKSIEDDLFSMDDIKVEVMRARGAGGQHVNKTESAVRLTHIPTGITVSMQDERSQHQNKRRAFQVLRARLLDLKITKDIAERRATRKGIVKTADRSEKIRTYNYAQDRVTDHRIGLSLMNLSSVLEGDHLQVFLDAVKKDYDEASMEDLLDNEGSSES